jgi:hypothetical protein
MWRSVRFEGAGVLCSSVGGAGKEEKGWWKNEENHHPLPWRATNTTPGALDVKVPYMGGLPVYEVAAIRRIKVRGWGVGF